MVRELTTKRFARPSPSLEFSCNPNRNFYACVMKILKEIFCC